VSSSCPSYTFGSTCQYVACQSLSATLRFHMSFDGDIIDSISGSAATGTPVTYSTGVFGQAATLGNAFTFPTNTGLNFGTEDISFCVWIRSPGGGTQVFFDTRTTANEPGYLFGLYGNAFLVQLTTSSFSNFVGDSLTWTPGTWYHLCFSIDRNDAAGLRTYRDGVLVDTKNPTGRADALTSSAPDFAIAGERSNSARFIGEMDDMLIFQGALTNTEVTALYNRECRPATSCYSVSSISSTVCSSHGNCASLDSCSCDSGYTGATCDTITCFNVSANSPSVCSSHGTCNAVDTCSCATNWGHSQCEYPYCSGVISTSGSVCSGHGTCTAVDTCSCSLGYSGSNCDAPVCFTVPATDPSVCNGHGSCTNPDSCSCATGYSGAQCNVPICFGVQNTNPAVCSSHGDCVAPDTCSCDSGYAASNCSIPICDGRMSSDAAVCGSHGDCSAPEQCDCDENWTDVFCNEPICFNIRATVNTTCSSRGSCISAQTCNCTSGFGGSNCQFYTCDGIPSNDGTVCSGKGICYDSEKCSCNAGWSGNVCQNAVCFGISDGATSMVCNGHGSCNSPDVCVCQTGYAGDECQHNVCSGITSNIANVCSGRGSCTSPDVCECDAHYRGPICEESECFAVWGNESSVCSSHGDCLDFNTCSCHSLGYLGDNCEVNECFGDYSNSTSVCSARGNCVDHSVCSCDEGHTGQNCEFNLCFGVLSNDNSVCSGRGTCEAPDTCICDSGYTGPECEFFVCFGISSNDTGTVCSSHGACVSPGQCDCDSAYSGSECNFPYCYGYLSTSSDVCSTFGNCTSPNVCSCSEGHAGQNCEYPVCFGILANESLVCTGNGSCLSPDSCECTTQYTNSRCEMPICFNINATSPSVCSTHGICNQPDTCICSPGYAGSQCELNICNGRTSDSSTVCSARGSCASPATCECNEGYAGSDCELNICHGILSSQHEVCSSHGSCLSPDSCSCVDEWSGTFCNISICFGVGANNGSVCSGHGECIQPDVCSCKETYTGLQCQIPLCFGTAANNVHACSSRGDCVSDNHCSCSSGYAGDMCELFICYGELSNETSRVCSGHGSCTAPHVCQCLTGYGGRDGSKDDSTCDTLYSCGAYTAIDALVCSGRGSCYEPDSCDCSNGYAGELCELNICNGILSNETRTVCYGNGVCAAPDTCRCNVGFTGDCDEPTCFGIPATDDVVCNGRGSCNAPNQCECSVDTNGTLYYGPQCNNHLCNGKLNTDGAVCSNHGSCISSEQCLCEKGWVGSDCEIPTCQGIPAHNTSTVCGGHGICESADNCVCSQSNILGHWDKLRHNESCSICQRNYKTPESGCRTVYCSKEGTCMNHGECNNLLRCECYNDASNGYFSGEFCSQCKEGYVNYPSCNIECSAESKCNGRGTCHSTTGDCVCYSSPDKGYFQGSSCDSCAIGYHGSMCTTFISTYWTFANKMDRLTGTLIHSSPKVFLNCGDLVHPDDFEKLGSSPRCQWSSKKNHQFEIVFGRDAKLLPNERIRFNVLIEDPDVSQTNRSQFISAYMLPPTNPVPPTAVLSAPPLIGSCSPLQLDATLSSSPDGRNLEYEFECLQGPKNDTINTLFSTTRNNPMPMLGIAQLVPGYTYHFSFRVKNFLGLYSNTTLFRVVKSSKAVPVSRIRGSAKQILYTSGYNALDGTSFDTECLSSARSIYFEWIQVSGPDCGNLTTIANGKKLVFKEHQLSAGQIYVFELRVHLTEEPQVYASSQTEVTVFQNPLHVEIAGGNRYIAEGMQIDLDGSGSYDPDGMPGTERFLWSCETETGGLCGGAVTNFPQLSHLIISPFFYPAAKYKFTLLFSKSDGRAASSSVFVTIIGKGPPVVEIESLPESVNSHESLVVTGRVAVASNQSVLYMWEMRENGELVQNFQDYLYTPINVSQIGIKANMLREGLTYTLTLVANNTFGSAQTYRSVRVNIAPKPGTLRVSPAVGYSLQTEFTLQATQWVDEDTPGPLSFGFSYIDPESQQEKQLAQSTVSSFIFAHLPVAGRKEDNFRITLGVRVTDVQGAQTKIYETITVRPFWESPTEDTLLPLLKLAFESEMVQSLKNTEERVRTMQVVSESLKSVNVSSVSNCTSLAEYFNISQPIESADSCQFHVKIKIQSLRDIILDRLLYESQYDESPKSENSLLQESTIVDAIMDHSSIDLDDQVDRLNNTTSNATSPVSPTINSQNVSTDTVLRANKHFNKILSEYDSLVSDETIRVISSGVSKVLDVSLNSQSTNQSAQTISSIVAADNVERLTRSLFKRQIPHQKATVISEKNVKIAIAVVQAKNLVDQASFSFGNDSSVVFSKEIIFGNASNGVPALDISQILKVRTFSVASNPHTNASVRGRGVLSQMMRVKIEDESGNELVVRNLSQPIIIQIPGQYNLDDYELNPNKEGWRPVCSFHVQNGTSEYFDSSGCQLIRVEADYAVCECNHLTDFLTTLELLVPDLDLLTWDDVLAIRTLNQDNMTVVVVLSIIFYVYIIAMFVLEFIYCCAQSRARKLQRRLWQKKKILIASWAFKEGGEIKSWKRRYFKLTSKSITYGKNGSFNIDQILLKDIVDVRKSYLERAPEKHRDCGLKITVSDDDSQRTYCVAFDSVVVRDLWFDKMQQAIKDQLDKLKQQTPDRGYIRPIWKLVREGHLWISVIFLPARGYDYTKSQRLTVIYLIILGIMVSNAMSWRGGQKEDGTFVETQYIVTGIVADLLSQPLAILAAFLFSKLRAGANQMTQDDFDVDDFLEEIKLSRELVARPDQGKVVFQKDEAPPFIQNGFLGHDVMKWRPPVKLQTTFVDDSSEKHTDPVESQNSSYSQHSSQNADSQQQLVNAKEDQSDDEVDETNFWNEQNDEVDPTLKSTVKRLINLHHAKKIGNWIIDQFDKVIGLGLLITKCINKKVAIFLVLCVTSIIYFAVVAAGCYIMISVITWLAIWATLMFAVGGFVAWLSILANLYLQAKVSAFLKSTNDTRKWRSGCLAWTNIMASSILLFICVVSFIVFSVLPFVGLLDMGVVFVVDTFFVGMIPTLSIWVYRHVRIPKRDSRSKFKKLTDKKWFPSWMKYPIYMFCFVGYVSLSFVLVLYGIKFSNEGVDESSGWWKACMCASFQNMILSESMRFIISTIIVVYVVQLFEMMLIRRRPSKEREVDILPSDPLAERLASVKQNEETVVKLHVPTFDMNPEAWGIPEEDIHNEPDEESFDGSSDESSFDSSSGDDDAEENEGGTKRKSSAVTVAGKIPLSEPRV